MQSIVISILTIRVIRLNRGIIRNIFRRRGNLKKKFKFMSIPTSKNNPSKPSIHITSKITISLFKIKIIIIKKDLLSQNPNINMFKNKITENRNRDAPLKNIIHIKKKVKIHPNMYILFISKIPSKQNSKLSLTKNKIKKHAIFNPP